MAMQGWVAFYLQLKNGYKPRNTCTSGYYFYSDLRLAYFAHGYIQRNCQA